MTLWDLYVKKVRQYAESLLHCASHSTFEVPIVYEILMAQAQAAEEVLKRHHELNKGVPENLRKIGLP